MLLDLIYWGFSVISNWQIEHLPSDVLLNFWEEIQTRRCREINMVQYTAAIAFDNKVASNENRQRLKPEQWLPYKLSSNDNKPKVSTRAITIIKQNRQLIPEEMIVDLYRQNILKPGE